MDYIVKQQNSLLIEQTKVQLKDRIIQQYIFLRKEKNLSQEDIANSTGIARTNISRIESGKYTPTIEVLTKLATAMDMDLEIRFVEKKQTTEE